MKENSIGRPPKNPAKRKREHYSVWLTTEQKKQIDQQIQQSNLSASQFFLSQVLENPMRRPKKKSLPKAVLQKIIVLEKLSGLLALSALKTKDKEMISQAWLQSSRSVRLLTHLITLWVFEDFDLPNLRKTLSEIQSETHVLYQYLEVILSQNEGGETILESVSKLHHASKNMLESFENYYQFDEITSNLFEWESGEPQEIHQAIQALVEQFLKQKV